MNQYFVYNENIKSYDLKKKYTYAIKKLNMSLIYKGSMWQN